MFNDIVSDAYYTSMYNVTVLSRPADAATNAPAENNDPWVVMIDNFVTPHEASTLIALGAAVGYERSTDVGEIEVDGSFERVVSKGRTSTNAWCSTEECSQDPTSIAIYQRIENLTKISKDNYEPFQLLKYEPGQFYGAFKCTTV
jgi:prolyl 4-hydroxylase